MMTKQELRKRIRDNIRLMDTTEKKAESECICRQIIATNEWQDARTVWLYASMPDEVNLTLLMQHAAQSGKRIVLPVVDGDNLLIRHYEPEHTSMSGVYNIEEPTSLCPTLDNPDEIDIAIEFECYNTFVILLKIRYTNLMRKLKIGKRKSNICVR